MDSPRSDLRAASAAQPFRSYSRRLAPLLLLAAVVLLALLLPHGLPLLAAAGKSQPVIETPPPGELHFAGLGSCSPSAGVVHDAAFLDEQTLLLLVLGPDGARVQQTSIPPTEPVDLLSPETVAQLCPVQYHDQLHLVAGAGGQWLALQWTQAGVGRMSLLGRAADGTYQPHSLTLPEGFAPARLFFSPGGRYLVLCHDALQQGSPASVLVYDVLTDKEYWRVDTQDLNFISLAWWGAGADSERFFLAATVHSGQFVDQPGIADFNLADHTWSFSQQGESLLLASDAAWGRAGAYRAVPGARAPYYLKYTPRGGELKLQPEQFPLNSEPVGLLALPDSAYVLLTNRNDLLSNQLWQVNLASGKRYMVDADCESCSLSAGGLLLVRGGEANSVRVYRLLHPGEAESSRGAGSGPPAADAPAADQPTDKPRLKRGRQPGGGAGASDS